MITRSEAIELVNRFLALWDPRPDNPRVVYEPNVKEHPDCYVCGWNSKRYIETREDGYQLAGNHPIIVDRTDGSINVLQRSGGHRRVPAPLPGGQDAAHAIVARRPLAKPSKVLDS